MEKIQPSAQGAEAKITKTSALPVHNENSKLEELLEKNLALTEIILENTRKTRRYMMMGQIINVVKIILIIGPIILVLFYLPPLIREAMSTYSDLLGGGTGQTIMESNGFLENIFGAKNADN